jgi:hypothetical protein
MIFRHADRFLTQPKPNCKLRAAGGVQEGDTSSGLREGTKWLLRSKTTTFQACRLIVRPGCDEEEGIEDEQKGMRVESQIGMKELMSLPHLLQELYLVLLQSMQ